MKTILNWKKGAFKSACQIYSDENRIIGVLHENNCSLSAEGELNGKKYLFKSKGFFNPVTQIIDVANNVVIGKITYNSWMTKARIEYDDSILNWRYDSCWASKWSIFGTTDILLHGRSSFCKGNIEFNRQNDLFVLTGLFISRYYFQMTWMIILIAMIPIWTITFH